MRNYRHVIKRFPLVRNINEAEGAFIDRARLEASKIKTTLAIDMCLDLDTHFSFIYDETNNTAENFIVSIVYEVYEIPQVVVLESRTLILYHNCAFEYFAVSGRTVAVDLEEAWHSVVEYRATLLGVLGHIEHLRSKNESNS